MMAEPAQERVDKWLWQTRVFKTRNQAARACRSRKITWNGQPLHKSSKILNTGDLLTIRFRACTRTVEVKGFPGRRVAARLVTSYLLDHTPADEYRRHSLIRQHTFAFRERGAGRPSKKERRQIENLKGIRKK